MSGDLSPNSVVQAALMSLKKISDVSLILVGDKKKITEQIATITKKNSNLKLNSEQSERLSFFECTQVVEMDDSPADSIRQKKDSSMRKAIDLVKDNQSDACVSSGNTGALMANAKFVLKTINGVDRPAICTAIPNKKDSVYVLDLGANVECNSNQLVQFAIMASILAKINKKIKKPKVGLLNIGSEESKGVAVIKEAHQILKSSNLNYQGFIEGDGIYLSDFDVIVCDGFIGNAILKCSEGLAKMFTEELKINYKKNIFSKLIGLMSIPIFKNFYNHYNPKKYNGASFLGLKGIVIKSHGNSDAFAFSCAIEQAYNQAKNNIIAELEQSFQKQANKIAEIKE